MFSHSNRLDLKAYAVLALLSLLVFLPGVFTLPPIDRDESRFTQASKQMVQTNDFVDIHFQDEARLKKPAGIYWLQTLSVKAMQAITGKDLTTSIWAYRLPSVLGAIISVLVTAAIGARLIGSHAGAAAGLLLMVSLLLNVQARMGMTDAALLASILTAMGVMAKAYMRAGLPRPLKFKDIFIFWLAIAAGFLIKGPIILLVTFGTLLGLKIMRQPIGWFRSLKPVSGTLFALILIVPWFYLVMRHNANELITQSASHDLFDKIWQAQNWGGGIPGFHSLVLWAIAWPISLPLFLGLPHIWKTRDEPVTAFLVAWIIPFWLVYELIATKLVHYVLPVYPAFAMLAAAWLMANHQDTHKIWRIIVSVIWGGVSLGLAIIALVLPIWMDGHIDLLLGFICTLGIAAATGALFIVNNPEHSTKLMLPCLAIAGASMIIALLGLSLPNTPSVFMSAKLMHAMPQIEGCTKTQIVTAGYNEPSFVFLAGQDTLFLNSGDAVARAMAEKPCIIGVVNREQAETFWADSTQKTMHVQMTSTVKGFNYGNGETTELLIYVNQK